MMHWKTLQTTIGAFALGICLTTVISPSQAAPFSALQETLKNAPTKIFKPLKNKTVGKIEGGNVLISDEEYCGVLQNYIDAKELKRADTKSSTINTGKGKTLKNTLEPIHAHTDIKSKFEEFILQAYPILGLDNEENPLGAKTEAKKKSLIEKLAQGDLSEKERHKTQKQLDQLFSQQLETLSKLWGSPQSKNLEKPLLVNMMAMKLINILTPYGDKTIDKLLLAYKNQNLYFMFDFIDQSILKAFDYDKKKEQISEYKRIMDSCKKSDFQYFAQEKASVITEYMSDQFKDEFEKKLKHWTKNPSPKLEQLMKTQKEREALDIKTEDLKNLLKKGKYQSTLSENQKNAIDDALVFYYTEAKGLGVGSGLLVAAFLDLHNETPGEKVSLMRNASAYEKGQTTLEDLIQKHMRGEEQDLKDIQKRIQDGKHTLEDLKSFYNALKKVSDTKKFPFSEKLQSRGLDFIVQELS